MADSLSAVVQAKLTVTETLGATNDLLFASAANRAVVHDQFNHSAILTGSTTPPVAKMASFRTTMSDGAASIDLTALTGTHGATIDFTGLVVHALLVKAVSTNGASLALAKHGTNGYSLNSSTTWLMSLHPGAAQLYVSAADTGEAVDATHKVIHVTGTTTDAVDVTILAG